MSICDAPLGFTMPFILYRNTKDRVEFEQESDPD